MVIKPTKEKTKNSKVGAVLVVGGGVGGIQASLDLADSGFKVYLVEEKPAIGGVMAQLDKTFPTNDCSMCILSPKLVEVGRHPNIELLTCSEVEDVDEPLLLPLVPLGFAAAGASGTASLMFRSLPA